MKEYTIVEAERVRVQDMTLESLCRANASLVQAKDAYEAAVVRCAHAGLSNRRIAQEIRKSETAIRLFLKRKGYVRD